MRGQKETRPCSGCGKELTKLLSQAPAERWFCSRQCQTSHAPPAAKSVNPYSGQQETRPCAICGEPITRYLRLANVDKEWTCSKGCMGKLQTIHPRKPRTGDTVSCLTCGKPFYRQPAYIVQDRRYCSQPCWNTAQRVDQIEKICVGCGNPFFVAPSEHFIKTCSRACKAFGSVKRPTGRVHNGKPVRKDRKGYVWLWEPSHPNKIYGGWQPEHRMVVERQIGRILTSDKHVDHRDQDKSNNDPSNLQVLTPSDHGKKTISENIQAAALLRIELAAREAELADIRAKLAALEP